MDGDDWVLMDGMLTAQEFSALTWSEQLRYLATLDDLGARAQATVLAAATGRTIRVVLYDWISGFVLPASRLAGVASARVPGAAERAVGR